MNNTNMNSKPENLETTCIRQANVFPQWTSGNNVFWYKRWLNSAKFEFVFVDCLKGVRRSAFDHANLAALLSNHAKRTIDPDCLPFWWINVAPDGAWVRFQFEERTWQYAMDGHLAVIRDEDFDMGQLDHGCDEAASPWSRRKASITFRNHTPHPLTYSWIDNDGRPKYYGTLQTGRHVKQSSRIGHIWRLENTVTKKKVACTVGAQHTSLTILDTPEALVIQWESGRPGEGPGPDDERSTSSTTEVFVQDFDVWARWSDGTTHRLSSDGSDENEFKDVYMSPDRRHAVAWQCRPPLKRMIPTVESAPLDQLWPKAGERLCPSAGDNVEIQRPRLFNLGTCQEIPVQDSLFQNPYEMTDLGWSNDGQKYRFIFNARGHQCLRILEIGLSGVVTVLVEEQSKTFIDYAHKLYYKIMETKNKLLWASERDGWNHLYLYDLKGNLKHQVTRGTWVVRSVEYVDEAKRQIWFEGLGMVPGQDPYYSHLVCVDFDGTNLRVVTEGDGTHSWQWSPDRQFLIDTWSRVDQPPLTVLRAAETGEQVVPLESANLESLLEAGWKAPERFAAPGRDGVTEIHGMIIRPKEFDESKMYPILERIYAGPQGFYTPKRFEGLPKLRRSADKGYVVVCIDGMGTNWRSKAFHDVCYKNLKDAGFPDRIAWIRAAGQTRPWMDISRVGCYGSSAGGQNAASAVLHYHDFYKAASAVAGCHDNRIDKLWWNELWMGNPVDGSYEDSSNITHAAKLGGALMLVTGEMDTSVSPSSTLRLARSLIESGKDVDLVYVPGGGHELADTPYVLGKQDAFFHRYLQGN